MNGERLVRRHVERRRLVTAADGEQTLPRPAASSYRAVAPQRRRETRQRLASHLRVPDHSRRPVRNTAAHGLCRPHARRAGRARAARRAHGTRADPSRIEPQRVRHERRRATRCRAVVLEHALDGRPIARAKKVKVSRGNLEARARRPRDGRLARALERRQAASAVGALAPRRAGATAVARRAACRNAAASSVGGAAR